MPLFDSKLYSFDAHILTGTGMAQIKIQYNFPEFQGKKRYY